MCITSLFRICLNCPFSILGLQPVITPKRSPSQVDSIYFIEKSSPNSVNCPLASFPSTGRSVLLWKVLLLIHSNPIFPPSQRSSPRRKPSTTQPLSSYQVSCILSLTFHLPQFTTFITGPSSFYPLTDLVFDGIPPSSYSFDLPSLTVLSIGSSGFYHLSHFVLSSQIALSFSIDFTQLTNFTTNYFSFYQTRSLHISSLSSNELLLDLPRIDTISLGISSFQMTQSVEFESWITLTSSHRSSPSHFIHCKGECSSKSSFVNPFKWIP